MIITLLYLQEKFERIEKLFVNYLYLSKKGIAAIWCFTKIKLIIESTNTRILMLYIQK